VNEPLSPSLGNSKRQDDPVSGILTFIIADLCVFALLFAGFMDERSRQVSVFNDSAATLNLHLGVLNTLILVSSGLCVVFAVSAARQAKRELVRRWLVAGFIIGLGFGVTKIIEYNAKFEHGINMLTNDFYMFYFALTGAHYLHFLGGMAALAFVWFQTTRQPIDSVFYNRIEAVGLYWHMVDLLWILIFPLLYIVGVKL